MMTDEIDILEVLTDDEMQALVDSNLYSYDGTHNQHATPNYRYCEPETPGYKLDWADSLWYLEAF